MQRELPDWITAYLEYTANSEPPTIYHRWGAMAVIAGALQRKVHLKMGFEKIYPNLFVILVGHSGRTRKGVALEIAHKMLRTVATVSIAAESSSREAIILAMKRAHMTFDDPITGEILNHSPLTAFPEELAVLLGQGDIKLLANLTDWYNSKDEWTYETVGRGRDALQGLCLNIFGATAPDWIQSMLPHEAVGGGFTSRCVFVVAERKRETVPEHNLTNREILLQETLSRDLNYIHLLKGPFTFSQDGRAAYNTWYTEQDKMLTEGKPAIEDMRFAGYCERRATHLRKLMMIMSASRSNSMDITIQDFNNALELLTTTERQMHKTFGGLGKAQYSDVTEKVMGYIKTLGITTRSQLLIKFHRDLDSNGLRSVEELMTQMRVIQIELIPGQNDKVYRWVQSTEPKQ